MQPGTPDSARSSRIPLPFGPVAGFAVFLLLVWALLAVLTVPARAQSHDHDDHVTARRWDADEWRAMPDGPEKVKRELDRQGEYARRWNLIHDLVGGQHVSSKSRDLLKSRGLGPALMDKGAGFSGDPFGKRAQDDTLKVLIIRIGFETNRDPNLTTIDPSGDFVLEPLTDPLPLEVDAPPRDKVFFKSHLEGLAEYYKVMSGGRLHIEGRVLPEGNDDSYKLNVVADYGPGA